MSRFKGWFAFFFAVTLSIHAAAQIGAYGTFSGARLGGMKPPYPYTDPYSFWTAGATFGIYDDFVHAGPVHLGIDARGSILNTHGHKLNSVLFGVRAAFKPSLIPLRPYVQGSVGAGMTENKTQFAFEGLGGIDATILPRIDWRVIELGGGALRTNGNNYPLFTLGTGIVIRIR